MQLLPSIRKILCALLKEKDIHNSTVYGIEIRTNGSSRSGRIPLVRINDSNQSVWKVVNKLKDVDKGIRSLDKLLYYLKQSRPKGNEDLPQKVLLAHIDEAEYLENDSMTKYVKNQVEKNRIIWFSSTFIVNLLRQTEKIDLNSFLLETNTINTKESFK
jgi:hypothetical protein